MIKFTEIKNVKIENNHEASKNMLKYIQYILYLFYSQKSGIEEKKTLLFFKNPSAALLKNIAAL
jgi:hypothetical protein